MKFILGNEKVTELLITHGADIAALNSEEENALHWGVLNGNILIELNNRFVALDELTMKIYVVRCLFS